MVLVSNVVRKIMFKWPWNTLQAPTRTAGGVGGYYDDKTDLDVARHINLALLMCNGISDEDAGFDTVTTINDAGLERIARIIGEVREAAKRNAFG